MLLRIGKGVDVGLLAAHCENKAECPEDFLEYHCFAMRDGFFESCPDSLFRVKEWEDAKRIKNLLYQFDHIVCQRDIDCFHNDIEIRVDPSFISHERMLEVVKKACSDRGGRLHINDGGNE